MAQPQNGKNGAELQRKLSAKGESLYLLMEIPKGATTEEIKKKYK